MENFDPKPLSWQNMRERLIENSIQLPFESSEDAQRAELRSESMDFERAFFDEGIRLAKERGLQPGSEDAWAILEEAAEVASSITFARHSRMPFSSTERAKLTVKDVQRIFRVTHDAYPADLIADARNGRDMKVDRQGLESSVSDYLRSEFRPPHSDRALLVALIDMEVTAYLREIHEKDILTGQRMVSIVERAPILTWLIGRGWAVLRLTLIIAAIIGIVWFEWITGELATFLIRGAVFLFLIGTAVSFVSYLMFRQRWKVLRQRLVELPSEMTRFYSELHSDGPLSVKRVRQLTQELSDMGAAWPGAVWALIDDMEARGVVYMT
mgnify:CR=1 FL=1